MERFYEYNNANGNRDEDGTGTGELGSWARLGGVWWDSRQAEVGHAYPLAAFSQVKLVKLGTKAVLISKLKRLSFTSDFTTYIV